MSVTSQVVTSSFVLSIYMVKGIGRRRSGNDYWHASWEVMSVLVGLERGLLSLVSLLRSIEELLE
jgi:hypothetical protein